MWTAIRVEKRNKAKTGLSETYLRRPMQMNVKFIRGNWMTDNSCRNVAISVSWVIINSGAAKTTLVQQICAHILLIFDLRWRFKAKQTFHWQHPEASRALFLKFNLPFMVFTSVIIGVELFWCPAYSSFCGLFFSGWATHQCSMIKSRHTFSWPVINV